MTTLTPYAVAVAARKAGWPFELIPWVVATSFGESSWRTDAVGDGAAYGDGAHKYYGLMQNSDIHKDRFPNAFPPGDQWQDPVMQMYVARQIYMEQGPTAFSGRPEKSTQAQSVTGQAQLAGAQVKSANIQISAVFGNTGTATDPTIQQGTVETVVGGKLLDALGLSGWQPVLWIGGGSILVLVGGLLLAKSEVLGGVGKVLAA